jgi:DNA uptake protein ComE-like DNA-binding protein
VTKNIWKIGRTKGLPETRAGQWGYKLEYSKHTNFNIKLERLIHLYLEFANFHRTSIYGKGKTEIEWFCIDFQIIVRTIDVLNHFLNNQINNDNDNNNDDNNNDNNTNNNDNDKKSREINNDQNGSSNELISKKSRDEHFIVWINNTTKQQLQSVKGVGPKIAHSIIASRPFISEMDIMDVRLIGKVIFNALKQEANMNYNIDNKL